MYVCGRKETIDCVPCALTAIVIKDAVGTTVEWFWKCIVVRWLCIKSHIN